MLNKRYEVPPAPPGSRPIQGEPRRQDVAPFLAPVTREPSTEPVAKSLASIGTSMVIKGQITSADEMFIDGEVEGKIELQQRLTIGPRGKVRADIRAREVVILGSVHGNVEVSDKVTIQRNGSLIGDLKTAGIVIDDGAYFKGSIDIIRSAPVVKAETVRAEPVKVEAVRAETVKVASAAGG